MDHLKEVSTDLESEKKERTLACMVDDNWELPSSEHSSAHTPETTMEGDLISSENTRPDS